MSSEKMRCLGKWRASRLSLSRWDSNPNPNLYLGDEFVVVRTVFNGFGGGSFFPLVSPYLCVLLRSLRSFE